VSAGTGAMRPKASWPTGKSAFTGLENSWRKSRRAEEVRSGFRSPKLTPLAKAERAFGRPQRGRRAPNMPDLDPTPPPRPRRARCPDGNQADLSPSERWQRPGRPRARRRVARSTKILARDDRGNLASSRRSWAGRPGHEGQAGGGRAVPDAIRTPRTAGGTGKAKGSRSATSKPAKRKSARPWRTRRRPT